MEYSAVELAGFANASDFLKSGVYALVYKGKVVYVGKAKGMLTRVYTHRSMWAAKRRGKVPKWIPVKGILFDEVFIRPCRLEDLDTLEHEMVNLYKPRYNVLLKTQDKISVPIPLKINGFAVTLNDPKRDEPMVRRV